MAEATIDMVIPTLPKSGEDNSDPAKAKGDSNAIESLFGLDGNLKLLVDYALKLVTAITGNELADKIGLAVDDPAEAKQRKKQTKDWFKWFKRDTTNDKDKKKGLKEAGKRAWMMFKGVTKQLGGILKAVSSNLLMDILKFVLFMAIFDPSGQFLSSILSMLGGVMASLFDMLMPWIPIIFNRMVNLITTVLPNIIINVIEGLFGWIQQKFITLMLEAESPAVKWIFDQLSSLFDPNGGLANFLKGLAKLLPLFVGLLIFVKIFSFFATIGGFLMKIGGVIKAIALFLWPIFVKIGVVLGIAAGWVVAIVAVVILIGVLIYVFWDEIKAFFAWVWEGIKKGAKAIWNTMKSFGKMILDILLWPYRQIWKVIQPIIEPIGKMFTSLGKILGGIWDLIKNTVLRGFNGIMNAFYGIGDWIDMVMLYGLDYVRGKVGKTTADDFYKLKQMSRDADIDLGKVKEAVNAEAGERAPLMSQLNANERILATNMINTKAGSYEENIKKHTTVSIMKGVQVGDTTNSRK